MREKVEQLVAYIQENCLWQFHSRAWDREENINGVLTLAAKLLTSAPEEAATPLERCHLSDARQLAAVFRSDYPWIAELSGEEIVVLLDAVKVRMADLTIKSSLNGELHMQNY